MCESNVYLVDKNGNEKLCMESVDRIVPTDDGVFMENIFSETKNVRAFIKEMALVSHRIVLQEKQD